MTRDAKKRLPPPSLLIPRNEAEALLEERIRVGKQLLELPTQNKDNLAAAYERRKKWWDYSREMLLRIFDNETIEEEYTWAPPVRRAGVVRSKSLAERSVEFRKFVKKSLGRLESILERLPLFPESNAERPAVRPPAGLVSSVPGVEESSNSVFVVHGHDDAKRESVARFVEKLGLKAIILHEQPNQGKTLIEKFEASSDVSFAVVLLTPDDTCETPSGEFRKRARQNVVFELGYFFGALRRRRVAALYTHGVELPSDVSGLAYIPLDDHGAWRLQLARELKAAGLDVDLNEAI